MKKITVFCFLVFSILLVSCVRDTTKISESGSNQVHTNTITPEESESNVTIPDTTITTHSLQPSDTQNSEDEIIKFKDKGLERVIRNKLNKPDGDVFASDLETITEIYVWNNQTSPEEGYSSVCYPPKERNYEVGGVLNSLDDFVYLNNLKHLTIVYQQIKDFSPLTSLTELESLNLADNEIKDFSFLKNMTKLKSLNISFNRLSQLSQITCLPSLEALDISYNRINNIKGLEELSNLKMLIIDQGWADDESRITDFTPLIGMKNLETLSIEANRIDDLTVLSGLTQLKELNLCQNDIKNVDPLSSLINMESLNLRWNQISYIQPLSSMTKLKKLHLYFDFVSDEMLLRQFPELTDVNFDWNKIPYPFIIAPDFAQEGIHPGNNANQSPVGFDGSSLYILSVSYGDLPHPWLSKIDLQTDKRTSLCEDEVHSLNIYMGKLYCFSVRYDVVETEEGYFGERNVIGLTRMNLDGSDWEVLTEEDCSFINIQNDKVYYLNKDNMPSRMELDGSNPEVLVDKPCKIIYATDNKLFFSYIEEGSGLIAKSIDDSTEEVIIHETVKSPIVLEDAIYFINERGNICEYEYNTQTVHVIKDCKATCLNINYRYIFYSDDRNIYRIDHDGSNERIIHERSTDQLHVVGDYLFFSYDGDLAKIKDDGSEYTEYFEYH